MLHGNLQMSKIFQSYAAITDLLKNHTYYRHITNGHRIYYRLFQYSCNLYDFLFFTPKNWQQSFSVPWKFHRQHFQVMLITFFFSSKNLPFVLHYILTFFSYSQQQPCRQTPDKFTKLISIFKTHRKSSLT